MDAQFAFHMVLKLRIQLYLIPNEIGKNIENFNGKSNIKNLNDQFNMNIYIDIDGVLLTKKQELPNDSLEFIDFITKNYDCFWLTTHCRTGENKALHYRPQQTAQHLFVVLV